MVLLSSSLSAEPTEEHAYTITLQWVVKARHTLANGAQCVHHVGEASFVFANDFLDVFGRPIAELWATVAEMMSHLPAVAVRLHSTIRILNAAKNLSDQAAVLESRGHERGQGYHLVYEESFQEGVEWCKSAEEAMRRLTEEAEGGGRRPASGEYVEGLGREIWRGGGEEEEEEEGCVICLEGFCEGEEVVRLECSHGFHRGCVEEWSRRSHVCPLCWFAMPREKVYMHAC